MTRLRAKRHIPERMERCSGLWFGSPAENKGRWRQICGFKEDCKLFLEIGCGKGKFCTETAAANPDVLYIAIERAPSVILAAIEKTRELGLTNLFFMNVDAKDLLDYFDDGEVDRIYINFCDPWTRKKKPKRRLTYRDFLKAYEKIMVPGGQIRFKTDNTLLFEFSLSEFKECGFTLSEVTRDLHNSEYDKDNVRTEFEQKFAEQGIAIKRCVATSGKQKGSDNQIIAL